MKKFVFFALSALVCISCGLKAKVSDSNSTPEQKWEVMQDYLAPGTTVSGERPMPDILSEQEVLLKAADYAYKIGALDSSYYEYTNVPALLTAKIETPILVYNSTGYPATYMLTVVDDSEGFLAGAYVQPVVGTDEATFETTRFTRVNALPEQSGHYITKREAIDLIKSQFSDRIVSKPIAVAGLCLVDDPYSSTVIFWYFTTNDNQRGASGGSEEYIIDSYIRGYKNSIGGVSNRSAISTGNGGSPHLDGARMAKLNTPLRLFEKLEAARSTGRSLNSVAAEPMEPIKYTPVPLR